MIVAATQSPFIELIHDPVSIGFVVLILVLAILNFRPFVLGSVNMLRQPDKRPTIDRTKIGSYCAWVIGLTLLLGLYNLAFGRNLSIDDLAKGTGMELFFLAVGLIAVILYKKDNLDKDKDSSDGRAGL